MAVVSAVAPIVSPAEWIVRYARTPASVSLTEAEFEIPCDPCSQLAEMGYRQWVSGLPAEWIVRYTRSPEARASLTCDPCLRRWLSYCDEPLSYEPISREA